MKGFDAYLRNWDAIKTQRMLMNDTLEEGFEKGLEKGLEQGREAGKAEGEIERQYKVAKKSLSEGLDVHVVSNITELSIEEVERIQLTIFASRHHRK